MQITEISFLLLLAMLIARLVFRPSSTSLRTSAILAFGFGVIALGIVFEGWRWQMLPAYVGFFALILGSLKRSETKRVWRIFCAVPLLVLLLTSTLLTHQLPILTLPAPSGLHNVGTFDYSTTDTTRQERYAPERRRELYVEVWYPADITLEDDFPVRTLYQELYEGNYDIWSFVFGYLKHVPTHSHIHAPIARTGDSKFPVLLFNHGGSAFTSQNQMLMEHLASHGYVIFSISHPYQSLKVNLENAGTITLASGRPVDIKIDLTEMDLALMNQIIAASEYDMAEISAMRGFLFQVADDYSLAQSDNDKQAVLTEALAMDELQPYLSFTTEKTLRDYVIYTKSYVGPNMQYWVEDIQFVADSIARIEAPIAGFSEALDSRGFGVFGMSLGGAAAGEFCKVDDRCMAGSNLDGTQFGDNWNKKVAAPFLMFYHEEHQGGNDYAYLPPSDDLWDYAVKGSMHVDFVDMAFTHPIIKSIGLAGEISGIRMIKILNTVQLNFFNHYLKGTPIPGELFTDIPEIMIRQHLIELDAESYID